MGSVKCCIICLGTEVKMYPMNYSLLNIYEDLISTTCKLSITLSKHGHACYECAHLLQKYGNFKTKCCKAYNILSSLRPEPFKVTEENLKSIDRRQNKLQSYLAICPLIENYECIQEDCGSDEQFKTKEVKTESSGNSVQDGCYGNPVEKSTAHVLFINNTDNNVDFKPDIKNALGYSTGSAIEGSNQNSYEIIKQTKEIDLKGVDEINELEPSIKLDIESFSSDDNDEDTYLVEVNAINYKKNAIGARKRKSITINKSSKMKKICNRESTVSLKSSDKKVKSKTKSKSEKKVKISIPNKTKKDTRLSLDSSFFRDYMTIIRMTPEEARLELLLRKESKNYKKSLHRCELCYKGFISDATHEAHLKKHSIEYGAIKCDLCQFNFVDKQSVTRHWIKCHTWKLLCKTCPYKCFCINQAKSHIESHRGKKYTCKVCKEEFRFPNTLATHVRSKHSIEVVCNFCGSTFVSAHGLECHRRLRHKKEKNEMGGPHCEDCDVHFASELAWKRHLVLCSRHQVQNGCVVCGDTFTDSEELKRHGLSHGKRQRTTEQRPQQRRPLDKCDIKPIPCKLCKKELYGRTSYVRHMNTDHPEVEKIPKYKSCVCEVCGRFFKHNSFLVAHQRTHTDEQPFACAQCGKRFKHAYTARMHMAVHTNEYRYRCHLCDKAFGDRSRLNRHLKVHHLGIRPYKCAYCDKSFLYQCEEKLHTKYVHCKEPYPKRNRRKNAAVKRESLN